MACKCLNQKHLLADYLLTKIYAKMKIIKPNIFFDKQREKWVVDLRSHGEGREFFNTKELAMSRANLFFDRVLKFGSNSKAVDLPIDVMIDAKRSLELLKPFGETLYKASVFYANHLKKSEKASSIQFKKAIQQWIDHKTKTSSRKSTLTNYKTRAKRIIAAFGDKLLSDVNFDLMYDWICGLDFSLISKQNYRDTFREFFNWCIDNTWIETNPCEKIVFRIPETEVSIFSFHEAKELWKAALKADPDIKRYVVVCMFAGVRPKFEASKIDRNDINESENYIRVHSGKTGKFRYIELEEGVLKHLINPTWEGRLQLPSFRKRWDKFRKNLGYRIGIWKCNKEDLRPKWPNDIMRHTYCSYHNAYFQNEARTVHLAGHTIRIFRKNYRRPIPKSEGEKFWNLVKQY